MNFWLQLAPCGSCQLEQYTSIRPPQTLPEIQRDGDTALPVTIELATQKYTYLDSAEADTGTDSYIRSRILQAR